MSRELFEGHEGRHCGEHRTTGGRAWCFDCSEWCYPRAPCVRCERPKVIAALKRIRDEEPGGSPARVIARDVLAEIGEDR